MLNLLYSILIAVFISSAAALTGRIFFEIVFSDKTGERHIDKVTVFLFSAGIGYIFLSALILAGGILGIMSSWFYLAFLLPLMIFSMFGLLKDINITPRSVLRFPFNKDGKFGISFWGFWIITGVPVVSLFFMTLFPDVSGDAYLYHLTVPNYYYRAGEIGAVKYSFCYNYPLQTEMLYLFGIILGSETGGVGVNFIFFLLILLSVYKFSEQRFGRIAGVSSMALIALLPILHQWAYTSHVEVSATFYLLLTLIALCQAFERKSLSIFFLSGIFAGGMVGAKLFYMVAFLMFVFIIVMKQIMDVRRCGFNKKHVYFVLLFIAGGALSYLPWLIKNLAFTNNPFFPFFNNFFSTRQDLLRQAAVIKGAHPFPLEIGLRFHINNVRAVIDQLSNTMNYITIIALFAIPIVFLIKLKNKNRHLWFYVFCLLCDLWVIHYGLGGQARWFIPVWIVFSVFAGSVIAVLAEKSADFKKTGLSALFIILFGIFLYQQALLLSETAKYPHVLFSRSKMDEYLEDKANYKLAAFINRMQLKDGKILIAQSPFNSPGRWFVKPFIQEGVEWFLHYEECGMGLDEAFEDLKSEGVRYILAYSSDEGGYLGNFAENKCAPLLEYEGSVLYEIQY